MSDKISVLTETRDRVKETLATVTDPVLRAYLGISLWSLNKAVKLEEKLLKIAKFREKSHTK